MIYFIEAVGIGHIKIGFTDSDDATVRMATLQTGSPHILRLMNTIPGTMEDEKDLHRQFASSRTLGEWFRPTEELLAIIRQETVLQCGNVAVESRSVQVRILTVGRKTLTANILKQLPWGSFFDYYRFKRAVSSDGAAVYFPVEQFERGDYWGWVQRIKLSELDILIFEEGGILYKYQIQPVAIRSSDKGDPPGYNEKLNSHWERCLSKWLAPENQLFIGT